MSTRIAVAPLPHIAAIYARVSTKEQDGAEDKQTADRQDAPTKKPSPNKQSLDTQEQGAQRWARAHDWLIEDRLTFRDRHTGEELWERPELTRLRAAARQRQFGLLICHSIDRLSRNPIHLGILLDELARYGVAVQFVTEELDDSPEAALIRFIKGYAGQVENERRRERQMRATRARVAHGYPVATGRAPYGYVWADDDKTALVPNPQPARVIVRIFTDYASGMTLRALAAALTAEGVPTPTGKRATWDPSVLRNLLHTSLYWGAPTTLKWRSERVPPDQRALYKHKSRAVRLPHEKQTALPATVAPPLVSAAIAAEVQRRLRANQQLATRSAKDPESALLRGLARCGLCGGAMHANRLPSLRRADGSVPVRYVCRNALKVRKDDAAGRYCAPHSVLADVLDVKVWDKVAAILRDPRVIEEELARMRETDPPGADDLAALDAKLRAFDARISGLIDTAQYARDPDTRRDLAGQIDLLAQQKRQTDVERAKVARLAADWERERASLASLTERVTRVETDLDTWGYAEKREALVGLKATVTLYPPGHTPRADLLIRLPLRGAIPLSSDVEFVI